MSSPSIDRGVIADGRAIALGAALLLAGCAGGGTPTTAWPGSTLARYEAAVAVADAGRVEEAQDAFAALAAAHPDYTGPHRQLARLALRGGDPDAAASHLRAARDACGECAAVLTELGLAERERGDFPAARAAYEAALATAPDFAAAHFDLAVLHELYLGRPGDAARHYERYLELTGETPEQRRIQAWIARLEREAGAQEAARLAAGTAQRSVAGVEP